MERAASLGVQRNNLIGEAARDTALLEKHLAEFQRRHGKEAADEEAQRLKDPAAHAAWRYGLRRKVGFMDVSSATNSRTMIATVLDEEPCGNKVPVLRLGRGQAVHREALLAAILNSLVYDYQLRNRFGGLSLNYFILDETAIPHVPPFATATTRGLASGVLRLAAASARFGTFWYVIRGYFPSKSLARLWAMTISERLRVRCFLDALVAESYGLNDLDMAWILRDCDYPTDRLRDTSFSRTLDPKGFWRVDKQQDPELRHTVLTLAAFRDLKQAIAAHGGERERGIEAFCTQNDGDGWMLPETLCLADLGLGHDDRAKKLRPVRDRLGPRFLPGQLEQSVEESWAECERHARNILGEDGFARLQAELRGEYASRREETASLAADAPGLSGAPRPSSQRGLFPGTPAPFGETMEAAPKGKKR